MHTSGRSHQTLQKNNKKSLFQHINAEIIITTYWNKRNFLTTFQLNSSPDASTPHSVDYLSAPKALSVDKLSFLSSFIAICGLSCFLFPSLCFTSFPAAAHFYIPFCYLSLFQLLLPLASYTAQYNNHNLTRPCASYILQHSTIIFNSSQNNGCCCREISSYSRSCRPCFRGD